MKKQHIFMRKNRSNCEEKMKVMWVKLYPRERELRKCKVKRQRRNKDSTKGEDYEE